MRVSVRVRVRARVRVRVNARMRVGLETFPRLNFVKFKFSVLDIV